MSAPPYMKLYVADYLGDTHHLGVVEHGAYLLLLMAMWRAGGSLPALDANLAKLARCTPDQWSEIREAVLPYFKRSRGRLTHKRLAEEMSKYENTSGKRSEAGKLGAAKKHNKDKAEAVANATETDHQLPPYPKPEPEPELEDKAAADDGAGDALWPPADPPDGSYLDALAQTLRGVAGASLNPISTKLFVLAPILGLAKPGAGPPCDLLSDVLPAIRACAARAPPGSVNSWDYFVPAIREARDRRLKGAPAEGPIHEPSPRPNDKLTRKQANLERALAGFDRVAGSRERP